MKRLTTIFALILLVTTVTFAQKGLHAAFKIIPQSTWMFNSDDSDDPDFRFQSTFGMALGVSANYHVTDGFGVGLELIFSRQGQKYENRAGAEFYNRVNYFKLPVLIFFNTNSENVVFFQGYFGPSFGFLTSAKLLDDNGDEIFDIEPAYSSVNVSLVLGIGLGFNVHENFKIHAGLRFDAAPGNAEDEDFVGSARAVTRNVNGGIELGFVYVLPTGR